MFLLFNDYYFDDAREKNSLNSCKTRWQKRYFDRFYDFHNKILLLFIIHIHCRFASDFFILAMSFIDNHNNNMHTTIDWLAVCVLFFSKILIKSKNGFFIYEKNI